MTRDLIFLRFNEMSVQTISVFGNPLKMKTCRLRLFYNDLAIVAVTKTPPAGKMDDRWTALRHWDVHDNLSLLSFKHTAFHASMVMLELCATKV